MTEHGQVPKGWVTKPLNDLVDFLDSQRRPIKSADRTHMRGQYPYYGASGIIDWVNDYLFDEELILLGEDGENILSRNLPLAFRISGKVWVNNHAHVFRPKRGIVDIRFLTELLEFQDYADLNSGTAQPKLNKASCKALQLTYPEDLKEQEAIAEALSDADALIEGLERLIAKKRLIKQGAMQDLLTAKRRLPGFSGEWGTDKIGNLARITTGSRDTKDREPNGIYPFFVRSQTVERINSVGFDGEGVLTAGDGVGTGKIFHYINGKSDFHQRVYLMHAFDESLSARYFYHYFSTFFYDRIMSMTAKSSVDSVRREMIFNMEIRLPPTTDEQVQITTILDDMDAEIQALDTRLEKARQVKEGMMQNLLTGRIRLV